MAIKPIKRDNVSDQAFEQIKSEIVSGEWLPGARIPSESDLVKMLNVSRITVRQALQKLIVLGLLEIKQGEGTFVTELSPDIYMNSLIPMLVLDNTKILQVLEFRRVTEIETGALAVDKADEEDIRNLESIYENMQTYSDNCQKFAEEDLNFHMALAEATKNPLVIKVNYIIKGILSASMGTIVSNLGVVDGLYYHKKIIEAIKERDRDKVKKVMEEHIVRTIERVSCMEELPAQVQ